MTAPIAGGPNKQLSLKRWFVHAYRVAVLGLASVAMVAAGRFVLRIINESSDTEWTLAVVVAATLLTGCAYGLFLNWVVGRNWAAYMAAIEANKDPGSYLKVLYPSRWPF